MWLTCLPQPFFFNTVRNCTQAILGMDRMSFLNSCMKHGPKYSLKQIAALNFSAQYIGRTFYCQCHCIFRSRVPVDMIFLAAVSRLKCQVFRYFLKKCCAPNRSPPDSHTGISACSALQVTGRPEPSRQRSLLV